MLKVAAALVAGGVAMGGWAVVTAKDLREYFVAGQQYTIEFKVRQHGRARARRAAFGARIRHSESEEPGVGEDAGSGVDGRRGQRDRRVVEWRARSVKRPLGARVVALVDRAEVIPIDMGVDLRRREIGVTQHLLHRAQIGATLQ